MNPKKLARRKPRGKNFGVAFLDVSCFFGSESEVRFAQKIRYHRQSKLSCLCVDDCTWARETDYACSFCGSTVTQKVSDSLHRNQIGAHVSYSRNARLYHRSLEHVAGPACPNRISSVQSTAKIVSWHKDGGFVQFCSFGQAVGSSSGSFPSAWQRFMKT